MYPSAILPYRGGPCRCGDLEAKALLLCSLSAPCWSQHLGQKPGFPTTVWSFHNARCCSLSMFCLPPLFYQLHKALLTICPQAASLKAPENSQTGGADVIPDHLLSWNINFRGQCGVWVLPALYPDYLALCLARSGHSVNILE